jgi:GNAT superfamily N-acetyltransferase
LAAARSARVASRCADHTEIWSFKGTWPAYTGGAREWFACALIRREKGDFTVSLIIRPLDIMTDLPRVAELYSQSNPEPISPEQILEWDRSKADGGLRYRLVAEDESGHIVGYGHLVRDPHMTAGQYWIHLIVAQCARGKGYGHELYQALSSVESATHLRAEVRDDCSEGLAFAERLGFTVDRHLFESTLDLASFDDRRFIGAIERASAAGGGLHFFSLADAGDTDSARRKLWEINTRAAQDVPGSTGEVRPFETFVQQVCNASWYRADGQILVADPHDQVVGMSAVGYFTNAEGTYMYNMMTGVLPEYRGRGIALALKLHTIACARRYGALYLRTNNDSENGPMLAVNEKLGYRREPGLYLLVRAA